MNLLVLAAKEPTGWLLSGDMNKVYWLGAAFLVVLGLYLWKGLAPTKAALKARTERIAAELAAAEQAKKDAAAALAAAEASVANKDVEAERIVAEAKARAEQLRLDLIARAEADVEETRNRARIEIEASKGQALADIRAEVSARALRATEALVADNLDDQTQAALIERYIQQVGA
jgi:F-type H+-transporting ATPase subunit b